MFHPVLEKNVMIGPKVLKCLLQCPVNRPLPLYDLLRADSFDPVVVIQIAPWMWRTGQVDTIQYVALSVTQVLEEAVVEREEILVIVHFLDLIRDHSGASPALVSVLFDPSPIVVPTLFDLGPFFTVPLY